MSKRIEESFRRSRAAGRNPILPYFTSGFPERETTVALLRAADRAGAVCVEIGVPYSDSVADGPVIQESFNYALEHGHRVSHALEVVSRVRSDVGCGLVFMLSYSILDRVGVERFLRDAASAGADGVIVPDLPFEEAASVRSCCDAAGLAHIGLVAPTSSPSRREEIVRASTGFVYQIAASGTTGERASVPDGLAADVAELRRHTKRPICVGFGLSSVAQVREVCKAADGAIVGSAIVRRIAEGVQRKETAEGTVEAVERFLVSLASP